MKIYINDLILVDNVKIANTFLSRLIGLLGKKDLNNNDALLLMNCPSVHCFFMKFTIDVIYLSKDMTVLDKETIYPWHIGKKVKNTCNILELAESKSNNIAKGDKLIFKN